MIRRHGSCSGPCSFCDDVPFAAATEIRGHAVRALYLLSGATDVYTENGDPALLRAALAQWDDMVAGKLYLTGGPLVYCFEAADLSGADPSLTGVSVPAGARAREVAGVTVGGHEVVALTVPGLTGPPAEPGWPYRDSPDVPGVTGGAAAALTAIPTAPGPAVPPAACASGCRSGRRAPAMSLPRRARPPL
jgi:hypothetical protein